MKFHCCIGIKYNNNDNNNNNQNKLINIDRSVSLYSLEYK